MYLRIKQGHYYYFSRAFVLINPTQYHEDYVAKISNYKLQSLFRSHLFQWKKKH